MKKSKQLLLVLFVVASNFAFAQMDLSGYKNIDGVHITSYWGEINAIGTESASDDFSIEAILTRNPKNAQRLKDLRPYIDIKKKGRTLYIATRSPEGFESIDLDLRIPRELFLEIKLIKGGNINAENFTNGVEVNILNGSVKLERLADYALVNAANGEINAHFESVDKRKPISLVTMNGGVTVSLPDSARRDVRLISRKNGYVKTDFKLETEKPIINLNKTQYSKTEIKNTAKINGGGALLFLSTENGPITIKRSGR